MASGEDKAWIQDFFFFHSPLIQQGCGYLCRNSVWQEVTSFFFLSLGLSVKVCDSLSPQFRPQFSNFYFRLSCVCGFFFKYLALSGLTHMDALKDVLWQNVFWHFESSDALTLHQTHLSGSQYVTYVWSLFVPTQKSFNLKAKVHILLKNIHLFCILCFAI